MANKRAKIFNCENILQHSPGIEWICIGGGNIAGKIAVRSSNFMEVVWKDNNEPIDDIGMKHYPFVNLQMQ